MTERIKGKAPERNPLSSELVEETRKFIASTVQSACNFSSRVEFLPTGNSMWNLVSSGRIDGGNPRGRIINIVGDGSSGKTLVALEFLAAVYHAHLSSLQSAIYGKPKRLILRYTNVEGVMDFNVEDMYGDDFYNAIDWRPHDTVEKFGTDFFQQLKVTKPGDVVIWIVDSWDAMDSEEDKAKFEKQLAKDPAKVAAAAAAGEAKEKGSYELGKQKYASKRFFKKICSDIHTAGADVTLVIVSQVKQKIGVTFGETRYRAGGDALNFYTHLVVWLAEIEKLKMQRLGHERVYGVRVRAKVKRSKVWKPFREVEFKILFDYGVDDVASMMDFFFGPKKNPVEWLGISVDRGDLYNIFTEDPEQLQMLKEHVQELWDKVETSVTPVRRKYQ